MNVAPTWNPGIAGQLRHSAMLLRHGASLLQRVLAVLLSGAFVVAAGLVLATLDPPQRAPVALVLAGIAVMVLWGVWVSRLVLLHSEARQARMPGVGRAIGGTLAVVSLGSVVLPGMLFAAVGMNPLLAAAVLAVGACAGLVVALLPRIIYFALCFAPLLIGVIGALWTRWGPPLDLGTAWRPDPTDVFWLVPPLLALAVWRWHSVTLQADRPDMSVWWQPAVASSPRALAGAGWFSGGAESQQLPDWMWPAGQTSGAGPARPVRAMRALLGTPFAPLSGTQILVQLGVGAIALLYLLLQGLADGGDPGVLVGGVIGGGGVLVVMYGQRLESMYRKPAGETDEFALLPGFGDAAAQRAHLLRAVLWSPSWACAIILAMLLAIGLLMGTGPRLLALMMMSGLGLVLLTAVGCIRPIAGQRLDGVRMLLLAGPVLLLALVTIAYALRAEGGGVVALVLALLWVVVYAVGGGLLLSSVRRFRSRPHPFIQR